LLEAPGVAAAAPPALAQLRGAAPPEAPGRALSEVLHAVADEQPVVVFVDDAHWLDRESLLALAAAARDLTGSPVLYLIAAGAASRAPRAGRAASTGGREVAGTAVKLGPLGGGDVRELARCALPSYRPDQLDRVARRVLSDSAGIPLLAAAFAGRGRGGPGSQRGPDAWPEPSRTLDQTLPGELPDNVVAAIRINFRRLSSDAQAVLVAAAVLGDRTGRELLGRVSGVAGNPLAGALDELEWQGWLAAEPRGYAFVAPIVRA